MTSATDNKLSGGNGSAGSVGDVSQKIVHLVVVYIDNRAAAGADEMHVRGQITVESLFSFHRQTANHTFGRKRFQIAVNRTQADMRIIWPQRLINHVG